MQQSNSFNYVFSFNERDKKSKQERKPVSRKKTINYIDTKYNDKPAESVKKAG